MRPPDAAAPVEVLISGDQLAVRIGELASEVSAHYASPARPPLLVGVLKGSTMFMADLVRSIRMDVEVDFMSISSYSDARGRSGMVRILKDLDQDAAGRDILIVEDIVDTGLSLHYLRRALTERDPRTVRAITLLDKRARRIVPVPLEFTGFEIADVFVVGYGLDFQGRYRNVREILAIRDVARLANAPSLLIKELWPRASARGTPG